RKGAMADARPRAESEKSRERSAILDEVPRDFARFPSSEGGRPRPPTWCFAAGRVHHINYPPPYGRTPSGKQG
ncbi:MAG: hypothetical protein Q4D38_14050, partial [Planctomycetia bacterium]|nr:hypothetical protein [Planctomycetia bacterium]